MAGGLAGLALWSCHATPQTAKRDYEWTAFQLSKDMADALPSLKENHPGFQLLLTMDVRMALTHRPNRTWVKTKVERPL